MESGHSRCTHSSALCSPKKNTTQETQQQRSLARVRKDVNLMFSVQQVTVMARVKDSIGMPASRTMGNQAG